MQPTSVSRQALAALQEVEKTDATTDQPTRLKQLKTLAGILDRGCTAYDKDKDAVAFAEFLCLWPELSPVTSAQLAGALFGRMGADELGTAWEDAFGKYLRALIARWPAMGLKDEPRRDRILAGLRRCFVTIRPPREATLGLRALTDADLHGKDPFPVLLRRAVHVLLDGDNGPDLKLYRFAPPEYVLPGTYEGTARLIRDEGYTTDLTFVPAHERDAVEYAIMQAAGMESAGKPLDLRGAVWPVTIPVPRGFARYELITGPDGCVRAERLGDGADRPLPAWLAGANSVEQRKGALKTRFGLAGVGDRPVTDARPERKWSVEELGRLASVYDRVPARDVEALKAVSLIRDSASGDTADRYHGAATHTGDGGAFDALIAEPTPHVHHYDVIFATMTRMACGGPGDSGSGGDATMLHELGHVVTLCPHERARRELLELSDGKPRAAYTSLDGRLRSLVTTGAGATAFNEWTIAYSKYTEANDAFATAAHACWQAFRTDIPPDSQTQQLLKTYAEARRAATAAAQPVLAAAQRLDAAVSVDGKVTQLTGVLLTRDTLIHALAEPGLILLRFARYAAQVGFKPFTTYGETSNKEFFAETYALYTTDRPRLWQLNWRMCTWLEAGYPSGNHQPVCP
ncbi:hypothetical protein [Nonomuraea sp. NPDC005650]|uniref:hypothetical protein n=1 Tax=Nonomuraea sp. NPDC005650 TaxID=3157045 RepID=UPI00339E7360